MKEEEEWHSVLRKAKVRAENESEEKKSSTAVATKTFSHGGRRESLVELIADLP